MIMKGKEGSSRAADKTSVEAAFDKCYPVNDVIIKSGNKMKSQSELYRTLIHL